MIPLFKVFMSDDVTDKLDEVLHSGFIGQGKKVDIFESELSEWFDNDLILTTNSATSAEHLSLHLLKKSTTNEKVFGGSESVMSNWPGVFSGDEVLCTPLTCTATNWPVLANNFKIKWVDVNPDNFNMDLDDLARKITHKTKIIMLVHWGGYPVDLDKVKDIQNQAFRNYGFKPAVIEDCAHAFGSTYKGEKLGNHGNICTFSFQAIKHITTVDGGSIVLPHRKLYDRAKLLRWYGINRENSKKDFRCEEDILEWGFKFHMNDVNATIGSENLKHSDKLIKIHKDNAQYYDDKLSNINGVLLPERKDDRESSFWIYSMLVDDKTNFMKYMKEGGIMVSQVHERNDIHSCVRNFKTHLPHLDKVIYKLISIPVGWWVSDEDREYIVECIKKGW